MFHNTEKMWATNNPKSLFVLLIVINGNPNLFSGSPIEYKYPNTNNQKIKYANIITKNNIGSKTIQNVSYTKIAADFNIAILNAIVPRLNKNIKKTIPPITNNIILILYNVTESKNALLSFVSTCS